MCEAGLDLPDHSEATFRPMSTVGKVPVLLSGLWGESMDGSSVDQLPGKLALLCQAGGSCGGWHPTTSSVSAAPQSHRSSLGWPHLTSSSAGDPEHPGTPFSKAPPSPPFL